MISKVETFSYPSFKFYENNGEIESSSIDASLPLTEDMSKKEKSFWSKIPNFFYSGHSWYNSGGFVIREIRN